VFHRSLQVERESGTCDVDLGESSASFQVDTEMVSAGDVPVVHTARSTIWISNSIFKLSESRWPMGASQCTYTSESRWHRIPEDSSFRPFGHIGHTSDVRETSLKSGYSV
jgi:hypothetical protein